MPEATKLGAWHDNEYFLLQCLGWTCDYWVALAHLLPVCPPAPVAVRALCGQGLYFHHLPGFPASLMPSSIPYRGLLLYEDKPCPVCPWPALQCSFFPDSKSTSEVCRRTRPLCCFARGKMSCPRVVHRSWHACSLRKGCWWEPGLCCSSTQGLSRKPVRLKLDGSILSDIGSPYTCSICM